MARALLWSLRVVAGLSHNSKKMHLQGSKGCVRKGRYFDGGRSRGHFDTFWRRNRCVRPGWIARVSRAAPETASRWLAGVMIPSVTSYSPDQHGRGRRSGSNGVAETLADHGHAYRQWQHPAPCLVVGRRSVRAIPAGVARSAPPPPYLRGSFPPSQAGLAWPDGCHTRDLTPQKTSFWQVCG